MVDKKAWYCTFSFRSQSLTRGTKSTDLQMGRKAIRHGCRLPSLHSRRRTDTISCTGCSVRGSARSSKSDGKHYRLQETLNVVSQQPSDVA